MTSIINRLFDIRKGEWRRALLMFAYIFLLIASVMILKPVRNSLFLFHHGAGRLPYVFILVALFAALVSMFGRGKGGKWKTGHQMHGVLFFSIASLVSFWFVLRNSVEGGWVLYLFYVWVSIYSVITAAQFWLLANRMFNAREARRVFGFLGTGAVLGGIFGGYLTNMLVDTLRTENLLFVCMGMIVACILILQAVLSTHSAEKRKDRSRPKMTGNIADDDNPFRTITGSRHLLYLAGIVGIGVIVATLADYQFNALAADAIDDRDDLTAFFGFWLSNLNILSLLIQVFVTGRVMKYLGVRISLFFLPLALLTGSVAVLAAPILWTAIMIKFSDGAFKHSINKSGVELLYLPVSDSMKKKAKTFIDVVVKNVATGVGGILLILLTTAFGLPLRAISIISIVFILFWLMLVIRVKDTYIDAFRQAILKRTIDLEQQSINPDDAALTDTLVRVLEGENERQIIYVLDIVKEFQNKRFTPHLKRLANHPSMEVKLRIFEMAQNYVELDISKEALEMVSCDNVRVSSAAVGYLCVSSNAPLEELRVWLGDDDYKVQCSAMITAARMWKDDATAREELSIGDLIDEMMTKINAPTTPDVKQPFIKLRLAELVGASGDPRLFSYLKDLLVDDSADIRCVAAKAASDIGAMEALPIIIEYLGGSSTRKCAIESLAGYGEEILEHIDAAIDDPETQRKVLLRIPRVIGMIGAQRSVDTLLERVDNDEDLHMSYEVLKALNNLREDFFDLKFSRSRIEKLIEKEIHRYFTILDLTNRIMDRETGIRTLSIPGGRSLPEKGIRLLNRVMEERCVLSLKRMFRLLGLRYHPGDMYNAYRGLISPSQTLRANAIEFMDNILSPHLKRTIVPIMEDFHGTAGGGGPTAPKGYRKPEGDDPLEVLLRHGDRWVRISVLYLVGMSGYDKCGPIVDELREASDPQLKETADWCAGQIRAAG
ncbi:MAG: MFS transporter [Candidatus Krumholzibacteria bacterium]|nr:MFS transporter [Candidatus Krumholzibacteria bacterium]